MVFSCIRRAFREYIAEPVDTSDKLNPRLLAIATKGYAIQSSLGISDAWGPFSPGDARFQVRQAASWVILLAVCASIVPLQLLICVLVSASRGLDVAQFLRHCAIWAAVDAMIIGCHWAVVLEERRQVLESRQGDWRAHQD